MAMLWPSRSFPAVHRAGFGNIIDKPKKLLCIIHSRLRRASPNRVGWNKAPLRMRRWGCTLKRRDCREFFSDRIPFCPRPVAVRICG